MEWVERNGEKMYGNPKPQARLSGCPGSTRGPQEPFVEELGELRRVAPIIPARYERRMGEVAPVHVEDVEHRLANAVYDTVPILVRLRVVFQLGEHGRRLLVVPQ